MSLVVHCAAQYDMPYVCASCAPFGLYRWLNSVQIPTTQCNNDQLEIWLIADVFFCRHWNHSEMWWPKLFTDGPEIAWDDYSKDYSDLPQPILNAHAVLEAEKDSVRQIEDKAKTEATRLQVSLDFRLRSYFAVHSLLLSDKSFDRSASPFFAFLAWY